MQIRRPLLRALNGVYRNTLRPAWARYRLAAALPRRAQEAKLRGVLRRARGTAFGRDHQLEKVRTLADFQAAVPVRDYDGHLPWIERLLAGEERVLTREAPLVFEKTSGATRASKFIPYTRGFLKEFSAATGPWLYDMLTREPRLRATSAYWSISPAGAREERTPGGVRIGFEDDTEYFPPAVRRLLRIVLPVPPQVSRLPDMASCRYVTLRYLLADTQLGFVSVWSPSYLTLLLGFAAEHAERLADDIEHGTLSPPGRSLLMPFPDLPRGDPTQAEAVRAAFANERPRLEQVWPSLALVSCWTDAAAQQQLPGLRALLPEQVRIQPKGLLATEGVVSFPLLDGQEGAPLAVASHLLELRPSDDPGAAPVLPHEAEVGGRYQPILTTAGGLYRYRLGDEVQVVGRDLRAPRVRFLGRVDGVSDLCGEKLSPGRVGEVVEACLRALGLPAVFTLLAPDGGSPPAYVLYVEPARGAGHDLLASLAEAVEVRLREGHHYDYCRRLEQLGPVRVVGVRDGAARYEATLVAKGVKAGNIKPARLHSGRFWEQVFAAN